jgi:tRNA dimethylallyltransferase
MAAEPIFLVGPTASGKSAVALELASQLGGEIISVDSMQVYRGLDIGTAKPSAEEQQRVRHHLIDVVDLAESFDAARFVALARAAEGDIRARRLRPVFCGGTGLYLKAYLEGLGTAPPANESLRARLETLPLEALLQELAVADPETYARIDQKNPRRVVRAVEVIRLTGKPFSEQRTGWCSPRRDPKGLDEVKVDGTSRSVPVIYGLALPSAELHRRINDRVERMFARGLVAETRALLERGLQDNRVALQALGYRQVVEHLRGERSFPDTVELVKVRTRQFAKRQMTWFRRQLQVTWLEVTERDSAAGIAARIANGK